jgi:hypothetical protein
MPKEWYISFHGGDEKVSLNNIHVYSSDGNKLRKALNKKSVPDDITLRELRGFVFGPDQNLYVVNAYFKYSEILKFKGALNKDGQHDFAGVFVKRHAEMKDGHCWNGCLPRKELITRNTLRTSRRNILRPHPISFLNNYMFTLRLGSVRLETISQSPELRFCKFPWIQPRPTLMLVSRPSPTAIDT